MVLRIVPAEGGITAVPVRLHGVHDGDVKELPPVLADEVLHAAVHELEATVGQQEHLLASVTPPLKSSCASNKHSKVSDREGEVQSTCSGGHEPAR